MSPSHSTSRCNRARWNNGGSGTSGSRSSGITSPVCTRPAARTRRSGVMRFRQPSTSRPGHNPHDVPGGPSVRASNSSYVGSDPGTGQNYRAHMDQVLAGVRVVEVATWTFVPAAGAVLADWGADVIKVE